MKSVWLRIDGDPQEYFAGYGYESGSQSTLEEMGMHIAEGLGHAEGITGISWWGDVPTAATVIDKDGLTETMDWQPDELDEAYMIRAGIQEHARGPSDIAPDAGGLFSVMLDFVTAAVIAAGGMARGGWDEQPEPEWMSQQRGEGGTWLKLPSGTHVGIAPIDLEGMYE